MRIRFEAPDADGPRLIREIPDFRLCYLEGENGIGKTLAARLLELVSGSNPFVATPEAWASLRDQLGTTRIKIDHLDPGDTLIYEIDPSKWPENPLDEASQPEEICRVFLNGKVISRHEAQQYFEAFRIGGDETLPRAIATELSVRASRTRRVLDSLAPRQAIWDTTLHRFADLTRGVSEVSLLASTEKAGAAALESEKSRKTLEQLELAESGLGRIRSSATASIALRSAVKASVETIHALRNDASAIEASTESLDRELGKLGAGLEASEAARAQLANLERLRGGRLKRLADDESVERSYLRTLGLELRPTQSELSRLQAATKREVEDREQELARIDLITPLHQTATAIESQLGRAVGQVGDGVVVARPRLSVRELLDGVRQRRVELEGEPQPGEVEKLRRELDNLRKTAAYLSNLREVMADTDRKRGLVDDVDGRIGTLLRALTGNNADEYRRLQQQRGALRENQLRVDNELLAATAALEASAQAAGLDGGAERIVRSGTISDAALVAAVTAQLALLPKALAAECPLSRADDLQKIDALLEATVEWADDQLRLIGDEISECRRVIAVALEARERADAELATLRHRIRESLDRMLSSGARIRAAIDVRVATKAGQGLNELRNALPPVAPSALVDEPEIAAAQLCREIYEASSTLADAAAEVVSSVRVLLAYLATQAQTLGGPADAAKNGLISEQITAAPALRSWVQSDIAQMFSGPELRAELFDSATDVRFDLGGLYFEWSAEGRPRRRPLEAFSSGEQVFAYTKAKLETLRHRPVRARRVLVILDEFGAFVSRDRLGHLLRFVELEALGTIADQIVVMLPLSLVGIPQAASRAFDASLSPEEQVASYRYFVRDELGKPSQADANG